MSNELTVIEPMEGEYIAAGEPEHVFTAEDHISETINQRMARQQEEATRRSQASPNAQMDALRRQQSAVSQGCFGNIAGSGIFGLFG